MAISSKASTRTSAFIPLVLCLALLACQIEGGLAKGHRRGGRPRLPGRGPVARPAPNPGTIFNVLQFGAKPGSRLSQAQAFMKTWRAACDFDGIATVVVPPGVFTLAETVFQGPCRNPPLSPITFQIQGTMKAVADPSEYSDKSWISFEHVDGLVLTGPGTIDGSGPDVWKYNDCHTNSNCELLPASLYLNDVKNAKVRGVTSVNSMGFHMHVTNSANIRINGVHIIAPADSPNTDGMHISRSYAVRVSKAVIRTGDDCISLGQGATNINVSRVTCGPGHGISVGSLGKLPDEQDVTGVNVRNCTMVGTTNGIRIKTWPGSAPSKATGMLFSNIVMDNVHFPIIIDQNYGTHSDKPSLVKISDITYEDIKGTAASEVAVELDCSPGAPCDNVKFMNINLQPTINTMRLSATCANANVGYEGMQFPPPCLPPHP
ncbi:hypothetical protein ACET3Z_029762 [Daucus carota]